MKRLTLKIYSAVFTTAFSMFTACTPESYELQGIDINSNDLIEGLAYHVSADEQNGNIIHLKSKLGNNYQVLWEHPQGRSIGSEVTLQIPFDGEYEVKFGVMTRGGYIYAEPHKFTIETFCEEFLKDELWTILTGGVGEEKTWVLDLNEAGQCKFFDGPLFFYGTDCTWLEDHSGVHGSGALDDCWNWNADWAGNGSWIFGDNGAKDYGTMTFDLKGGANLTVTDLNGKVTKGTFSMDTENHTMKTTDVSIIHDAGRDAIVTQWGNITILSLTENSMQLGVLRDNDPSEGPCLLCYNFISKEYADNWRPEVPEESVTVPYPGDDSNNDLTTTVTSTMKWTMNTSAPFDWMWWNKTVNEWETNGFASYNDYVNSKWAPVYNVASVEGFSMDLTKKSVDKGVYSIVTMQGETVDGEYTTEGNIIRFDKEIRFLETSNDKSCIVTSELHIIKKIVEQGEMTEMWLGVPTKKNSSGEITEYQFFKINPVKDEGSNTGSPGIKLSCDNSKILYGDLEGNGNYRIELYNQYSGTGTYDNPPFAVDEFKFSFRCDMTFTISGLGTLNAPVTAFLMCSSTDQWKGTESTAVNCEVTGDGTYTVSTLAASTAGLSVLCIDLMNIKDQTDIDLTVSEDDANKHPTVTATIDSIVFDKKGDN